METRSCRLEVNSGIEDELQSRKNVATCLVCWAPTSSQQVVLEIGCADEGLESLRRQLTHWFILRNVLDLPLTWCERNLADRGTGLETWFQVCTGCVHNFLEELWQIQKQIAELDRRRMRLKMGVRAKMEEGARGSQKESKGIEMEIRKLVVPGLEKMVPEQLVKVENELMENVELGEDNEATSKPKLSDDDDDDWQPSEEELRQAEQDLVKEEQSTRPKRKYIKKVKRVALGKGSRGMYKKTLERIAAGLPPKKKKKRYPKKRKPVLVPGEIRVRGKDKQKRKSKHSRPRQRDLRPKRIVYPCAECRVLPFINIEDLERHQRLHAERKLNPGVDGEGQSLDCQECSFPAVDSQELLLHLRFRHENMGWKRSALYECPLSPANCTKTPDEWALVVKHVLKRHSEQVKQQLFQRYLYCDQCPFQGQLPRDLLFHRKKKHVAKETAPVTADQALKCEHCGILCATERELQMHVNSEHRRVNRFVCEVCGRGFMHASGLKGHMACHTKHLKRDWVCDICGVDFPRKETFLWHQEKFHGPETPSDNGKVFKCKYCELTSPFNAVIRKHLQTHKQEGEWKCQKCGKFYMNKQGLLRHQRINHNESGEVVKCPNCQRPFPSKEYMQIHFKRYCKLKAKEGE